MLVEVGLSELRDPSLTAEGQLQKAKDGKARAKDKQNKKNKSAERSGNNWKRSRKDGEDEASEDEDESQDDEFGRVKKTNKNGTAAPAGEDPFTSVRSFSSVSLFVFPRP